MHQHIVIAALAIGLIAVAPDRGSAGAPQPEQRAGDFAHVCKGGPNRGLACTVASEASDCPRGSCVVEALSKTIKGTLTLIAHDTVTDWATGTATHQALTVLLEVKAPGGAKHLLAATYQNITTPTLPPAAPTNVVAIDMDEAALQSLAAAVTGLAFAQPEAAFAEQLQTLFGSTGTPAIVAVLDRKVDAADHTGDALATVLRFKVKLQFLAPL